PDSAPSATAASGRGAGSFGFAGTVTAAGMADTGRPEGLIALADGFGGGPTAPRLPHSWSSEPNGESPGSGGRDPGETAEAYE
ncbi:MAG TPA: hypothetical protein VMD51_15130, partial [Mycobacterium sp.]|nr:hypothetical protein [Mycobacterium sp.]